MILRKNHNKIMDSLDSYIEATGKGEFHNGLVKAKEIIEWGQNCYPYTFDDFIEMVKSARAEAYEVLAGEYDDLETYLLKMNVRMNKIIRKSKKADLKKKRKEAKARKKEKPFKVKVDPVVVEEFAKGEVE
jgi:hypothetical protein